MRDVQETTGARGVRAHVMLPTGRGTRIVVYSYGMVTRRPDGAFSYSSDSALEIAEAAGCSGAAFTRREPVCADLEDAARDPGAWRMTRQEHDRVPPDRKAMVSVPIWGVNEADVGPRGTPVGTLSVDTSTPLADTLWREGPGIRSDLIARMLLWEYVVGHLLQKRHP